jgi:hypothetical protein
MSGGKGGRSSTSVEIPAWLESAARQNIARADEIAQIGYVPYYGPDVAAMTPMQMSAGGNINAAAGAFGLGAPTSATAGMPPAMDYGGMGAYSSGPLFDQSLAQLQARRPGQFAALQAPFIDPVTGAPPAAPFSANLAYVDQINAAAAPAAPAVAPIRNEDNGGMNDMMAFGGGRSIGPMQGPISPSGAVAESGFRSDLSRSLSDPFYDPPGNVISRALGTVSPEARAGDSMGGRK